MNFYKFTNEDGTTRSFVNLDAVTFARPDADGKINLFTYGCSPITVERSQFEQAISEGDSQKNEISMAIGRLIHALDRLTVHLPTSIRMHM